MLLTSPPSPPRRRRLLLALTPVLAGLLLVPTGPAAAAPLTAPPVTRAHLDGETPLLTVLTPPEVTGQPVVGEQLTASPVEWSQPEATTTYQWQRDDAPVAGATDPTYVLGAADVGGSLAVVATGQVGDAEPVTSTSNGVGPVQKVTSAIAVTSATSPGTGRVHLEVQVSAAGEDLNGTLDVSRSGVRLDPVALTHGLATVNLTGQSPGSRTYALSYRGDDRVAASSVEVVVEVLAKASASVSVAGTSNATGRVLLSIAVGASRGTATGAVTVEEGSRTLKTGLPLVGGRATWSASGLKPGRHAYTVVYGGSAQVSGGSRTTTVTILDKATAEVSASATSAAVGKLALRIRVGASRGTATGAVTVKEGTRTLKKGIKLTAGRATWSAGGLKPGKHAYTVLYGGSPTVTAASAKISATVKAKAKPSLGLRAASPSANKVKITIAVKASGQAGLGGTAKIREGSTTRAPSVKIKNGKASWSASRVKAGKHTYTVTYNGTSQVKSGSAKVSVTVKKPLPVREFANCTEMHEYYVHGVGRPGASDQTSGTPAVTDFFRSTELYELNTKSDRDDDGIACEQL